MTVENTTHVQLSRLSRLPAFSYHNAKLQSRRQSDEAMMMTTMMMMMMMMMMTPIQTHLPPNG